MRGADGPIRYVVGLHAGALYLYAEVPDATIVYAGAATVAVEGRSRHADHVRLVSASPPYLEETLIFAAEAPGPIVTGWSLLGITAVFDRGRAAGRRFEARARRRTMSNSVF